MPKVKAKAVISVPFFNEADFLEETLQCLKDVPEGPDLKFFLCDNASDDGSGDIAKRFADKDTRFVYHRHDDNVGPIANFQFAYKKAECDYFMWLGAHDIIDATYPQAAMDILDQDTQEEYSYACADMKGFKEDIVRAAPMDAALYSFHDDRLVRYMQSVAKLGNCTLVNTLFRRKALKDFKWRETISWDHVAISHILWHGKIHVTRGHNYYRRFFKEAPTSDTTQTDTSADPKYPRIDFLEFYVDDFDRLYDGPEVIKTYLRNKLLSLLEQRFTIRAMNNLEKV